jgi:hypothetical protein
MADVRVSAIAAMTPAGAFGWRGGDAWPATAAPAGSTTQAPGDWFDAARHLAGVKHRYLNDAARYGVAASLDCLRDARAALAWPHMAPERRGLVLGTAVADYAVRHALDAGVRVQGFSALNTVAAPNISANIAAAHIAIACQARAFSTTLTSPFLSGLESLFMAAQSLRRGRADAVLAMAAEEAPPVEDAAAALVPGAVALHLQADVASRGGVGPAIAASCWGHAHKDAVAPSMSAHVFLANAVEVLGAKARHAELMVLRQGCPLSAATLAHWLGWLEAAGLAFEQQSETVFPDVGTVAPMLRAAQAMASPHPVLLLAIHQRRYLSFLFLPTPVHQPVRSFS